MSKKMIICNGCHAQFEDCIDEEHSNQGYGCSSTAKKMDDGSFEITGHYGSRLHDFKKILFSKESVSHSQFQSHFTVEGNLCDICIEELISIYNPVIQEYVW